MEGISQSEWEVMRVVWTLGSVSAKEIISNLDQTGWQASTIKTLIGRLVKKGCLHVEQKQRPYQYSALITEDKAMNQSAVALFQHFCAKKKGQTLVQLVAQMELSQADVQNLQQLLSEKQAHAPKQVACDCLKGAHCE
ncbi:CopY/TcrY family copper transport repressor [Bombilactobacillus folatiphilus]|uniref:CopY/TcrY family copper transport repressor n=1 Tax=Bombilactobacillus folatiphilus TaxID=2923362 RepID=A0ABY4P7R8_9LACO|nr:CopY/TcrY family copper transport repressor [Bombilactobacillus folatiphilus]UQS81739.1 CopY/TcrY family copper transport repressor [Bombilactobacillus folatiphilus]